MKFCHPCMCLLSAVGVCCAQDVISADPLPCAASDESVEAAEYDEVTATQVELLQVQVKHIKINRAGFDPEDRQDLETTSGNHIAKFNSHAPLMKYLDSVSPKREDPFFTTAYESSFPLVWVHVPKCGSIKQWLITIPGACDQTIDACAKCEDQFFDDKCCPGLEQSVGGLAHPVFHSGIGAFYHSHVKGHGVIMLRQPEQRIISGYYDEFHSWPFAYYGRWPKSIKEYAEVVSGCAVRMITREGNATFRKDFSDVDAPCGLHPTPATAIEAQVAMKRLESGFVFVGLTENWDTSLCLFHLIFGGSCFAHEFRNTHPGANSSAELYDISELNGFVDVYDGLLYDKATQIYNANLMKYGATASVCEQCFRHAAISCN